ncbi:MAG: PQQ-binding-like beta-propeller repeat protein, partial [Deltaproteobacteria bacterium]|nr:PQQ-binding-like beta-propeller repeat protein [Deltaproteobacteria bacterium]
MTFSLSFPDNEVAPLRRVLSQVDKGQAKPMNGRPMAYLVTRATPPELLAFDLESRKVVWRRSGSFISRVIVGEKRLYHLSKKSELMARATDDGRVLWTAPLPQGARLLGMATDGPAVYLTLEAIDRAKMGAAGYLMAFSAAGKLRFKRKSSGRLGAPAARGGVVFVPLRHQSLAVVDGVQGEEIARIRSKEEVILWVRATVDGIYYGGRSGVYRLDEKSVSGKRAESTFVAAALPESVRPAYWWDGYNAALAGYTAYDRNRLLWDLEGETSPTFTGDTIVVHNYRFFFGFSGKIARRGREEATTTDPRGKEAATKAAQAAGVAVGAPSHRPQMRPGAGGKLRTDGMELTDEGVEQGAARLKWAYSFPREDVVASAHTGRALVMIS